MQHFIMPPIPPSMVPNPFQNQQQLYGIQIPHDNDVLCGRGVTTNRHPGNKTFRNFVARNKELYVSSTKKGKMTISRSIVESVRRQQNPPGRFLEKDPSTQLWFDIGDKKAVEKTSQALRDGAAGLRKQLSEDFSDPAFLTAVFDTKVDGAADKKNDEGGSAAVRKTNSAEKPPIGMKQQSGQRTNPGPMKHRRHRRTVSSPNTHFGALPSSTARPPIAKPLSSSMVKDAETPTTVVGRRPPLPPPVETTRQESLGHHRRIVSDSTISSPPQLDVGSLSCFSFEDGETLQRLLDDDASDEQQNKRPRNQMEDAECVQSSPLQTKQSMTRCQSEPRGFHTSSPESNFTNHCVVGSQNMTFEENLFSPHDRAHMPTATGQQWSGCPPHQLFTGDTTLGGMEHNFPNNCLAENNHLTHPGNVGRGQHQQVNQREPVRMHSQQPVAPHLPNGAPTLSQGLFPQAISCSAVLPVSPIGSEAATDRFDFDHPGKNTAHNNPRTPSGHMNSSPGTNQDQFGCHVLPRA